MPLFPILHTKRFILRKASIHDIPKIVEYANNVKIAENVLNIPEPFTEDDAIKWINAVNDGFERKQAYVFSIARSEMDIFVGAIGLHLDSMNDKAELGYWIGEPNWNQGIATEAIAAILKFGFEILELQKIYATHFTDNPASGKVMINNHMIPEGELKDHYKKGDHYKTVIQYRLTKEEYSRRHKNID